MGMFDKIQQTFMIKANSEQTKNKEQLLQPDKDLSKVYIPFVRKWMLSHRRKRTKITSKEYHSSKGISKHKIHGCANLFAMNIWNLKFRTIPLNYNSNLST